MRTLLLTSFICCCGLFSMAQTADNSLARVNELQGIKIFTDCKPVAEYEFLGELHQAWGTDYNKLVKKAIEKGKEEYPTMNGIIIRMRDNATLDADCIKFK